MVRVEDDRRIVVSSTLGHADGCGMICGTGSSLSIIIGSEPIRQVGGLGYLIDTGGSGCVCPEHVMLKAVLANLTYRKNDVVIMDMEAGLEHLGRGTAGNMDQFIVVIEPGARSVQTYHNVKRLAADLGVKQVRVVANKVRDTRDEEFVKSQIPAEDLLGFIHYNTEIMDADRQGKSPYDFSPTAIDEIRKIKDVLDSEETN